MSPAAAQTHDSLPTAAAQRGPLQAAPDQFLQSGDMRIHYREVGAGEPVILVHGWSRTLDDWDTVATALAPTHRVIAMDVRGFGKSDKSGDYARFGTQMADDVIRLMDHLGIRRAHLAGMTMGSLIVANVAARYPARVSTVTMVAGPFYGREGCASRVPCISPGDSSVAARLPAARRAQNDSLSLIASMSSFSALDITAGPAPRVPALFICGAEDSLLEASHRMAAWWPGARMVDVAGATRMVLGRVEVGTAMRAFMK